MDLYVDYDGYVCFQDGEIFWTLHHKGWEAFTSDDDGPLYSTNDVTFPTDNDLEEAHHENELRNNGRV